jgi:hypothetical protein
VEKREKQLDRINRIYRIIGVRVPALEAIGRREKAESSRLKAESGKE